MRLLIDSNIWRYLVDSDAIDLVRLASQRANVRVLVAPAVVYEAMRVNEVAVRARLIKAMTMPVWKRLMPEAYSEADELKAEIRRARPQWLRAKPDLNWFRQVRYDWMRPSAGFWDRVRSDTSAERARILAAEDGVIDRARDTAQALRDEAKALPAGLVNWKLSSLFASPGQPIQGWAGQPVALWRFDGWQLCRSALMSGDSTHLDWLGGEIDVAAVLADSEGLVRFWFYDARESCMPRYWLRTAFEFQQRFHKVTDGTPCDVQLATYLLDADVVVSADKNFIRFAERCRSEGPFPLAKPVRLPVGPEAASALVAVMRGTH